ncbi:hypothetical protein [Pantoea agglomerans]|uniref:hypothetical protein n=1 Tax=Enterobacter agglomerans TaxID=549 RepID=UPI003DA061B2
MIKIIRQSKMFILLMAGFMLSGIVEAKMQKEDIWGFVAQMSTSIKNLSVERIHQAPLPFTLKNHNEYINFYQANPVKLHDASTITDIELRLSKTSGGMAPFLSFAPQGKCISLDEVKEHYQSVKLTDYPRGQSENEVTSYTSSPDGNGQFITFSFSAKNPDCLSKIIITADE